MRIGAVFLTVLLLPAQDGTVVGREQLDARSRRIRVAKITYLSDGLKINGYLLSPATAGKYPCIIYNRGGNSLMNALNDRSILECRIPLFTAESNVYRSDED